MSQISPFVRGPMIGGPLNFGQGPSANLFTGGLQGLGQNYQNAYQNALNLNQQNYQNILGGYQQMAQNQQQNQQNIGQGWQSLYNNVLGGIQGIQQSQQQNINDQYAQQRGASAQQLLNSGLGNTTVRSGVDRGLTLDQNKANINLANQFAGLQAGYQSQLGQGGLNYANQANQQNTGLGLNQLGWMNSINAPYPNEGMYANLANQYGMAQQAGANRQLLMGLLGQGGLPGGAGFGSPIPQGPGNPAYPPSGQGMNSGPPGPSVIGRGNQNVPQGSRYAPPRGGVLHDGAPRGWQPGGGGWAGIYPGPQQQQPNPNGWNSGTFQGRLPGRSSNGPLTPGDSGGGPFGPPEQGGGDGWRNWLNGMLPPPPFGLGRPGAVAGVLGAVGGGIGAVGYQHSQAGNPDNPYGLFANPGGIDPLTGQPINRGGLWE